MLHKMMIKLHITHTHHMHITHTHRRSAGSGKLVAALWLSVYLWASQQEIIKLQFSLDGTSISIIMPIYLRYVCTFRDTATTITCSVGRV